MAGNGAVSAPDDLIELGRIVSAYGVHGWVKIQPHSAQADVLRTAPVWWLAASVAPARAGVAADPKRSVSPLRAHVVKQVRRQGLTIVADLEGVGDRDVAENMRGYTVHVSRHDFPAAKADEFYWIDLVGCNVYGHDTESTVGDSVLIGIVDEVVDNGAHALLRVHRYACSPVSPGAEPVPMLDPKGRPVEILVPFVSAHVQHVDIKARRIDTDWPIDF